VVALVSLVILAAAGVRMVNRRADDERNNRTKVTPFDFHFEPVVSDSQECDAGRTLTEEDDCRRAYNALLSFSDRFKPSEGKGFKVIKEETGENRIGGCTLHASEQGWAIKYNPSKGKSVGMRMARRSIRICGHMASRDQIDFFVLGEAGESCEGSPPLRRSQCLAAAFQIMVKEGSHNLKFKDTDLGEKVPKGCSIKTGGNWAVYFNANLSDQDSHPKFSPVCGQHPWGLRRKRAEDPSPSSIASSSLTQQNETSHEASTCDPLSYAMCCNHAVCNTCNSRRRHLRTGVTGTYCPWFYDITCCAMGIQCHCR